MGFRFSLRKWIHLQCFTKEVISEKAISEIQPKVIDGFCDLKAVDQGKVEEVLEEMKSAKTKIRNRKHAKAGIAELYLSEDEGDKADDPDVVEDLTDLLKSINEAGEEEFLNSIREETVRSSRSFLHYTCKHIGLGLILQPRYSNGSEGLRKLYAG